jgi:hypothetical protein
MFPTDSKPTPITPPCPSLKQHSVTNIAILKHNAGVVKHPNLFFHKLCCPILKQNAIKNIVWGLAVYH